MSRVLADLLGTNVPAFYLGLKELERAAGAPRADISLTHYAQNCVSSALTLRILPVRNFLGRLKNGCYLMKRRYDTHFR